MTQNKAYKLADQEAKKGKTIVEMSGLKFWGKDVIIIAGPCTIESKRQLIACTKLVKNWVVRY